MRPALLVLLLVLVGCGDSNPAPSSPEGVARIVVEAFRTNDFSLCEPILMDADDLEWVIEELRSQADRKSRKVVARFERDGPQKMLQKIRAHIRKTFDRVRQEGDEEQFAWADVQFEGLHKLERNKVGGIEAVAFYIRLRIGDKLGEIRVTSLMRAPRGWIVTDGFKS